MLILGWDEFNPILLSMENLNEMIRGTSGEFFIFAPHTLPHFIRFNFFKVFNYIKNKYIL